MSKGQTLAVVSVSVLLAVTLFGATVAMGTERTALDEEYVGETFEGENVDTEIRNELRDDIATRAEQSDNQQQVTGISIDLDGEAVADSAVTGEFVASELNRNIEISIQYLRGSEEEFDLRTDLREVKTAVRAEIVNGTTVDTPQLVGGNTDRVGAERVAMLSEGEQEYREARIDLTTEQRTEVEEEIETNVRRQLSNDSGELTRAVLDHQYTVLDGLTGELTYEEYVDRLAADEREIKSTIATNALAEVPDEQQLFGEDEDPESALGPIRTGAQLTVTLTWLLPLLAAGLVSAIYAVTRSVERTTTITGAGLLVAGILGAILGFVASPVLKGAAGLGGEKSDPIIEGLSAVVDGTLQTVGMQSLVLAVVGLVVLTIAVADRRGLLDGLWERLDLDSR
jgi:hypothetical protein